MTEARAQVRMTFLSRVRFILSIFSFRDALMNGPFLDERLTCCGSPRLLLSSLLFAAADDQLVRGLLGLARAQAQGRLAPRRLRVSTGSRLALATTVGMVAGVHGRAADGGPHAEPAAPAGLATGLVLVLDVTDLADRGLAVDVHPTQLTAWHADDRVVALLREQLSARTRAPDQLAAAPERQLDVVDGRTDRDVGERDRVADAHRRLRPALDGVADLQSER